MRRADARNAGQTEPSGGLLWRLQLERGRRELAVLAGTVLRREGPVGERQHDGTQGQAAATGEHCARGRPTMFIDLPIDLHLIRCDLPLIFLWCCDDRSSSMTSRKRRCFCSTA